MGMGFTELGANQCRIFPLQTTVVSLTLCSALTSQVLCDYYFGSEDAMIRLDMSEYMERHTVSKLIGAPPGVFTPILARAVTG